MAAPVGGEWRLVVVDFRRHIVNADGISIATFADHVGEADAAHLVDRANAGLRDADNATAIKDAAHADAFKAAAHRLQIRITELGATLADLRWLAAKWAEGRDGEAHR